MSAKSSTFAAEMIENMTIDEMRHTAWRCRNSYYYAKDAPIRCRRFHKDCDEKVCGLCKAWEPSECAEAYFKNRLTGTHYKTISQIMLERVRKGTF